MQLIYASIRTSYIILSTYSWGSSYRSVRPCSQGLRRCPWPCSTYASAARRRTMPPPRLPSGRSTRRRSTPAPWSYLASSWSLSSFFMISLPGFASSILMKDTRKSTTESARVYASGMIWHFRTVLELTTNKGLNQRWMDGSVWFVLLLPALPSGPWTSWVRPACSSRSCRCYWLLQHEENTDQVSDADRSSFRVERKPCNWLLTTHVEDNVLHANLALTLGALLLLIVPPRDPDQTKHR